MKPSTPWLLGSSCPDAPSAARLFALCEPLESALENCASPEALLPALETELNTPAGQEALEFLELSEYPLTPAPGEV